MPKRMMISNVKARDESSDEEFLATPPDADSPLALANALGAPIGAAITTRKKSVRFSRFQKVFLTHSPCEYDRSPDLSTLIQLNARRRARLIAEAALQASDL
ncbi:hypothetical protein DSO57_1023667 [Entomophthora muscae]|uniref:Uncharacterized protein n=1 Tax=Entomophthora muscae TaxID=34485 RepID=A0ACC2RTZ0_9FUNG|nr:hypothetical protein DSO57_1023667 [Entomophthora muscae]